ncbi:MAG: sulfatase-like hydrolase/transferase [Acidobacteria bacterium]|nr:sulfatase-like hydrolase/transferase [Acidobacteriota bacterium]
MRKFLTGLLPYQHGIRDNSGFRLEPSTPTVATLLKAKGYATGAFVGAFPLDSRFGLARGFDVYDDRYPKGKTALDFEMPERPAPEVVSAALAWWNGKSGQPRFLWVHLYDCHAPYRPPSPFRERFADDLYLGEVAAVDAALAPLLGPFLEGKGPPALIIVTADHGEARGDHGEESHGLFAYESTLHVPLILWMKGAVAPGSTNDSVRHVDIAPTVLAAARISKPAGWTGSSLLGVREAGTPAGSYFEAYSTAYNRGWAPLRGMLGDRYKYVDLPVPELYDLNRDPGEQRNLAAANGEELRRLARTMAPESSIASPRSNVASEDARRLKSLGYLSGNAAVKKTYGPEDDPKNLVGIDRELHACVDLYQRGELVQAVALARRVVAERPTMPLAYQNLAFLLRQQGASAEALRTYDEAVGRGVAQEDLMVHFGLALCESGRAPQAVRVLLPFSESRDPETLNALGIAYSDSGQPGRAASLFARTLDLDAGNVEAYENLGIVHLRGDDAAAAKESFRRALAIDDRLPRAWNGLGVALARLGNEREAIDSWSRAVVLDPKLYDALFNLGLTAAKNGMRREARGALERFVATAPLTQYAADVQRARQLLKALGTGS